MVKRSPPIALRGRLPPESQYSPLSGHTTPQDIQDAYEDENDILTRDADNDNTTTTTTHNNNNSSSKKKKKKKKKQKETTSPDAIFDPPPPGPSGGPSNHHGDLGKDSPWLGLHLEQQTVILNQWTTERRAMRKENEKLKKMLKEAEDTIRELEVTEKKGGENAGVSRGGRRRVLGVNKKKKNEQVSSSSTKDKKLAETKKFVIENDNKKEGQDRSTSPLTVVSDATTVQAGNIKPKIKQPISSLPPSTEGVDEKEKDSSDDVGGENKNKNKKTKLGLKLAKKWTRTAEQHMKTLNSRKKDNNNNNEKCDTPVSSSLCPPSPATLTTVPSGEEDTEKDFKSNNNNEKKNIARRKNPPPVRVLSYGTTSSSATASSSSSSSGGESSRLNENTTNKKDSNNKKEIGSDKLSVFRHFAHVECSHPKAGVGGAISDDDSSAEQVMLCSSSKLSDEALRQISLLKPKFDGGCGVIKENGKNFYSTSCCDSDIAVASTASSTQPNLLLF